jgi:hypothetical protein
VLSGHRQCNAAGATQQKADAQPFFKAAYAGAQRRLCNAEPGRRRVKLPVCATVINAIMSLKPSRAIVPQLAPQNRLPFSQQINEFYL